MYSLRIQVLVVAAAYYEQALKDCIPVHGATGQTEGEKEEIRLKRGIRCAYHWTVATNKNE
jgi:hypothetical protein